MMDNEKIAKGFEVIANRLGELSEVTRQRDELARLVKGHNSNVAQLCDLVAPTCRLGKMWDGKKWQYNPCFKCPRRFMIDLPGWAKDE